MEAHGAPQSACSLRGSSASVSILGVRGGTGAAAARSGGRRGLEGWPGAVPSTAVG